MLDRPGDDRRPGGRGPASQVGETDAEIVCRTIAGSVDGAEPIAPETEIRELGGWDSIAVVNVIAALEERLRIRVPVPILTQSGRVSDVIEYVRRRRTG